MEKGARTARCLCETLELFYRRLAELLQGICSEGELRGGRYPSYCLKECSAARFNCGDMREGYAKAVGFQTIVGVCLLTEKDQGLGNSRK